MIGRNHIQRFIEQQRALIHDAYDEAWKRGVGSYTPDEDPQEPTPAHLHRGEEATLRRLSLLQARSQRNYVAPKSPDADRRQAALAAALASTEKMAGELATLGPSPEQRAQAEVEADEGKLGADEIAAGALSLAVAAWAESNAYRLDAGESVAWAGEQAGYAEAADSDGQLLQWQSEDDDRVCGDCADFEALGPLPLSDFPTMPGSGDTECNVGCRCSMEAAEAPQDELTPLSGSDEAALDKVAMQAQNRLDELAPSFAATG